MPSVLLPAPHFEQSRDGACLPACVRMLLAYWDDWRSEDEIAILLSARAFGTPLSNVARLDSWGYDVAITDHMQRSEVEDCLKRGIPVIARVWTAMLDYWQQVTSHVIVVIGYDEERIFANDPTLAHGAQTISWDAFLAAWAEFDEVGIVIRPA